VWAEDEVVKGWRGGWGEGWSGWVGACVKGLYEASLSTFVEVRQSSGRREFDERGKRRCEHE